MKEKTVSIPVDQISHDSYLLRPLDRTKKAMVQHYRCTRCGSFFTAGVAEKKATRNKHPGDET